MVHVEKTLELRPPPVDPDDDAARVFLPSADSTQEIRAEDVLEAIDLRRGTILRSGRSHPSSLAPVAMEVARTSYSPDDSLLGLPPVRRPPNKRLLATVGVTMGACVLILAGAAVRSVTSSDGEAEPARAAAMAVAPPKTPTTPNALPVTTSVSVESPAPMSGTGTITFPRHAVAILDGKRLGADSAIVACGEHTVRIGRGALKKVVVPCGGTIAAPAR